MENDYLFVYGTLLREHPSRKHDTYLRANDFVCYGKVRGQLFWVADYPGLVLHPGDQWVHGEIYLLNSNDDLHRLDVYEGCARHSPQPHEYERRLVELTLTNGSTESAWAYVYIQSTENLQRITSGNFLTPV